MVATAARASFIQAQFRRAIAESPEPLAQFGSLARQTEDPMPTYFDSTADAAVVATERQELLSPIRRRFTVALTSIEDALGLAYSGTLPVVRYTDSERGIEDRAMLVGGITIDFEAQATTLSIWG